MTEKHDECPKCGAAEITGKSAFDYDGQRCACGWNALAARPTPLGISPDRNVEAVRAKLLQRSQTGLEKYGTTTERTDLGPVEWLTHLQEELMDAAVYAQRIISDVEAMQTPQDPRLLKLLNSATAEADAFMDAHTTADGRWLDDDDKAEYYRQCTIIDDAREALGLPTGRER